MAEILELKFQPIRRHTSSTIQEAVCVDQWRGSTKDHIFLSDFNLDLAVILALEVSVVSGDGGWGWVAVGDSDIKASQEVGRSGCAIQNQSVTH